MVVLIVRDENIPHIQEMIQEISKDEDVKSIILNINKRKTIMCVITSREYYKFKNLWLFFDHRFAFCFICLII